MNMESERVPQSELYKGEIEDFINSIDFPETKDLLDDVEAKISRADDVLAEIRVAQKLVDQADGDEELLVKKLNEYLGGSNNEEESEDDEDEEDEAEDDSDDDEGWGSDDE